jgi:hypothetical protein
MIIRGVKHYAYSQIIRQLRIPNIKVPYYLYITENEQYFFCY